jgi:hypothetical protein
MLTYDDLVELARLCARNSRMATTRDVADELWRMAREYQAQAAPGTWGRTAGLEFGSIKLKLRLAPKDALRRAGRVPRLSRPARGVCFTSQARNLRNRRGGSTQVNNFPICRWSCAQHFPERRRHHFRCSLCRFP